MCIVSSSVFNSSTLVQRTCQLLVTGSTLINGSVFFGSASFLRLHLVHEVNNRTVPQVPDCPPVHDLSVVNRIRFVALTCQTPQFLLDVLHRLLCLRLCCALGFPGLIIIRSLHHPCLVMLIASERMLAVRAQFVSDMIMDVPVLDSWFVPDTMSNSCPAPLRCRVELVVL